MAELNQEALTQNIQDMLRITVYENPYIDPSYKNGIRQFPSVKQAEFLSMMSKEVVMGGAKGGGKTSALLAAALQYVMFPWYKAFIVGKTLKNLGDTDRIIPRSQEWIGDKAHYSDKYHLWKFPSGARLQFLFLSNDKDLENFRGPGVHFIGVEELTLFPYHHFTNLFGCLRSSSPLPIPLRFRGNTNPGGIGHQWVYDRFVNPLTRHPDSAFMPALFTDNPGLDHDEYSKQLDKLPYLERMWFKYGDWNASVEGNFFKRKWMRRVLDFNKNQIVWRVRAWDMASTVPSANNNDPDWTAGVLIMKRRDGIYIIADMVRLQGSPREVEMLIRRTAEADGGNTDIVIEREPGSAGETVISHYQYNVLPDYVVYPSSSNKNKIDRAKPLSGLMEKGEVVFLNNPSLEPLKEQMVMFPTESHDDYVDACCLALNYMLSPNISNIVVPQFDRGSYTGLL